ncbi:MAG: hypothetical protein AB7P02_15785 [Alphaproteobacteria bacterium]
MNPTPTEITAFVDALPGSLIDMTLNTMILKLRARAADNEAEAAMFALFSEVMGRLPSPSGRVAGDAMPYVQELWRRVQEIAPPPPPGTSWVDPPKEPPVLRVVAGGKR